MWVPFHTDKKQPDVIGTLIIPPMQMGKLRPEKLLGGYVAHATLRS